MTNTGPPSLLVFDLAKTTLTCVILEHDAYILQWIGRGPDGNWLMVTLLDGRPDALPLAEGTWIFLPILPIRSQAWGDDDGFLEVSMFWSDAVFSQILADAPGAAIGRWWGGQLQDVQLIDGDTARAYWPTYRVQVDNLRG